MVKDRKSLLEQIYDGEFYPNETVVSGDPDYVITSADKDRKAWDGGRNWRQQKGDTVISA